MPSFKTAALALTLAPTPLVKKGRLVDMMKSVLKAKADFAADH